MCVCVCVLCVCVCVSGVCQCPVPGNNEHRFSLEAWFRLCLANDMQHESVVLRRRVCMVIAEFAKGIGMGMGMGMGMALKQILIPQLLNLCADTDRVVQLHAIHALTQILEYEKRHCDGDGDGNFSGNRVASILSPMLLDVTSLLMKTISELTQLHSMVMVIDTLNVLFKICGLGWCPSLHYHHNRLCHHHHHLHHYC